MVIKLCAILLGSETKTFHCSECGKMLATKQSYREHQRQHTGEGFICDNCGQKFTTNSGFSECLIGTNTSMWYYSCFCLTEDLGSIHEGWPHAREGASMKDGPVQGGGVTTMGTWGGGSKLIRTLPKQKTSLIKTYFSATHILFIF